MHGRKAEKRHCMFGITNALTRGSLLNDDPAPGGGDDPTKPMTAAEVQEIVGRTVNAAVTSQLKRALAPAVAESLKAVSWKDVLAPIVTELVPKPAEPQPGNEPPKPDPKLSALEAKYAELDRRYQETEKQRVEAEQARRDSNTLGSLKEALKAHIRPELLDMVARDLFVGQKRVTYDDAGRPLMTVKRAPYAGAAEEDVLLPLEDGAAHFAKYEGKSLAPAPVVPGTKGSPAPRANPRAAGVPQYDTPATTDAEKIRRSQEQAAALAEKYPHLAGR